ncbi:MAG: hypothetical protein ABII07_06285 [Patescibacteria group bacterium]|nr:hypothetical protein [Patescibacteria group bacterium]
MINFAVPENQNTEGDIDLLRGCSATPNDIWTSQIEGTDKDLGEWLESPERFDRELPEANWCGLCCVRAIAKAHSHTDFETEVPSLIEMFRAAVQKGVYQLADTGEYEGAYHYPLADFIRDELRLPARAIQNMGISDIHREVESGNFVIASVDPTLRYPGSPTPENPAGHFVLVHGIYFRDLCRLKMLDSTGLISQETHINPGLPADRFRRFFSGRAILVKSQIPMSYHRGTGW